MPSQHMKILRSMLGSLLLILTLGYIALCALLYVVQDSLIFQPTIALAGLHASPEDINLAYEDVYLSSTAGREVHAWYLPKTDARATILFLHGNAGNIAHRLETLRLFHTMGFAVLIFDYQGYGQSPGAPSEQHCYDDAASAWAYLTDELKIPANEIILFGRSMGGGVASWLAERHTAGALILESTFLSIPEIARQRYPFLPVRWLARTRFDTASRLHTISIPVVVIHSPDDEIVPFSHGQGLYELAGDPKRFFQIKGDHNSGYLQDVAAYRGIFQEIIKDFF